MNITRTTLLGAALAFASLTACGKKDEAAKVDTTPAAGAAPGPVATALSVVDVDMGRHIDAEKKISDKTDDFAPNDTIYASVHTSGTATGVPMIGRWTFENGTVVDERTESLSPTGDAYTEFHIVKPGGWPKGKYTLHVLINGAEVRTKDVTVK
jgi:hypothetical protein